jgi:hypothetical protein
MKRSIHTNTNLRIKIIEKQMKIKLQQRKKWMDADNVLSRSVLELNQKYQQSH